MFGTAVKLVRRTPCAFLSCFTVHCCSKIVLSSEQINDDDDNDDDDDDDDVLEP